MFLIEPHTRVIDLVRMLSNGLSRQIEHALRPVGLTQAQFAALAQLAHGPTGGLSGAWLALGASVTPQSMSNSLAGLEWRGLVVRGPHPTQPRVIQARITRQGRELLERACELTNPLESRALALLNEDEHRQLVTLLLRTMSAIGLAVSPDRFLHPLN